MDVNSVDNISMNDGTQNLAGHKIVADIKGVMIDAAAIVMGGPSDIILSGPIDWIAEEIAFRAELIQ